MKRDTHIRKATNILLGLFISASYVVSAMEDGEVPHDSSTGLSPEHIGQQSERLKGGGRYSKKRLQELEVIYRSALDEIKWVLETYPLGKTTGKAEISSSLPIGEEQLLTPPPGGKPVTANKAIESVEQPEGEVANLAREQAARKLVVEKFEKEESHESLSDKATRYLFKVIKYSHPAMAIEYLVQQGANVNARDQNGYTPLYEAVYYGNNKAIESLRYFGAKVNVKIGKTGITYLHLAAIERSAETIESLCKPLLNVSGQPSVGTDVNVKDQHGYSPLLHAVLGIRSEAVKALLALGANVNATKFGATVLDTIYIDKKRAQSGVFSQQEISSIDTIIQALEKAGAKRIQKNW
jgi:hypothetical protein